MLRSGIKWINEPPIVEIHDKARAELLCKKFGSSIETWKVSWEKVSQQLQEQSGRAGHGEARSEAEGALKKWNERIDRGLYVASTATWTVGSEYGHRFFAYMLYGNLIGLILVGDRGSAHPYIEWVATHPGSETGGGILIEFAVNLSAQGNGEGRLELTPLDAVSAAAWEALGFIRRGKDSMLLNPEESEKWVKLAGRWQLTKYQERKRFAGPA